MQVLVIEYGMVNTSMVSYQHSAFLQHSPWHVFVYGTLRQGASNDINCLEPKPKLLTRAKTKGVLFNLGAYPGLLLPDSIHAQSKPLTIVDVVGEVYAVSPALLPRLDALEEITPGPDSEYCKRWILIKTSALSRPLACLVYEIAPSRCLHAPSISSGDWFQRA